MDARLMGCRLVEARSAWDLSREDLAALSDVTIEELVAAEGGEGDVSTFAALADALGGTFNDLLRGRRFWDAPNVAYRGVTSAVDRPLVRATLLRVSRAAVALREAKELEARASESLSVAPAPLEAEIAQQAEQLAALVRSTFEHPIEPLQSVRDVCRRFGFGTFLSSFGTEKVDGLSWRDVDGNGFAAANVDARRGAATAIRMTFAHELCHLLFDGTRARPFGVCETRTDYGDGIEQRANAFAAHLLAPRDAVIALLARRGVVERQPNPQHVLALAGHFGMGAQAMGAHLVSLGLWERRQLQAYPGLHAPRLQSPDTIERVAPGSADVVPLEQRGDVLDLATALLADGRISRGRWRELVGTSLFDDVIPLLREREALHHAEHHSM